MSLVFICYDGFEKLDPDFEIYMIKVYLDQYKRLKIMDAPIKAHGLL